MSRLVDRLIAWALQRRGKRALHTLQHVVTFDDKFLFDRYAPLWPDEFVDKRGRHHHRPPWWRPFNVLLHRWHPDPGTREAFHDHPRWTATICLKGEIIERTPWGDRRLRPGSLVLRSRRAIHAFEMPADQARPRCWTVFIVGRRDHLQNTYQVVSQAGVSGQVEAGA